jgi:hypothetical protein
MKQKIVIYLATQWIYTGWGGVGWIELDWMKIGENFNFVPPQLEPLRAATVRDQTLFETAGQAGFVGLFIGHYYWYRLA